MEELAIGEVINAYKHGIFPMANSRDALIYHWYDPPKRALLPIKDLHISRSLKKSVLKGLFKIKVNTNFDQIVESCAELTNARPSTWINDGIIDLFRRLHDAGYAHSVEAWNDNQLVGGLYGLAIGSIFMGESMFSKVPNASKVCLVHLCARLWKANFNLLDTQFVNSHLLQFGVYEVEREKYIKMLKKYSEDNKDFLLSGHTLTEDQLVQEYLSNRHV